MQTNTNTQTAFVSTNSIAQGEQTGILWNILFNTYKVTIYFAHQTFKWNNETSGIAAVHCVIIGFGKKAFDNKYIFEYNDIKGEPHKIKAKNISPYLIEGKDFVINSRLKPICNVQKMIFGSKPVDNGQFLFTNEEKKEFLIKEPKAEKWFKSILGSEEFINGKTRWCLWLEGITPNEIREMPLVYNRISNVKEFRLASTKGATIKDAEKPHLFSEPRYTNIYSLIIPSVFSENRKYIPIGYLDKDTVVSNAALFIPNATLYNFGILTSAMHMAWVKTTCGRLKSDFRYSNTIVYNNYPFPSSPSEAQTEAIERAAQKVLDVRASFEGSSLADLYDPLTMPPALQKAHADLDKAVDLAYRPQPFATDAKRLEYLFELYEKLVGND